MLALVFSYLHYLHHYVTVAYLCLLSSQGIGIQGAVLYTRVNLSVPPSLMPICRDATSSNRSMAMKSLNR